MIAKFDNQNRPILSKRKRIEAFILFILFYFDYCLQIYRTNLAMIKYLIFFILAAQTVKRFLKKFQNFFNLIESDLNVIIVRSIVFSLSTM